ncbi:MAG: hypothetical protein R2864_02605 [Syntrophotaleaceae bacterium]
MNDGILCSFYGKDDDCCDVGCDYISSSDVPTIIRYCSADYRSCHRYQELAHRFSIAHQANEQVAIEPSDRQVRPPVQFKDPLVKPFKVKWSLPSLWHQVSTRSMLEPVPFARQRRVARILESQAARQAPAVAGSELAQGPVPMGLMGFGVATVLLGLQMTGLFPWRRYTTMGIFMRPRADRQRCDGMAQEQYWWERLRCLRSFLPGVGRGRGNDSRRRMAPALWRGHSCLPGAVGFASATVFPRRLRLDMRAAIIFRKVVDYFRFVGSSEMPRTCPRSG